MWKVVRGSAPVLLIVASLFASSAAAFAQPTDQSANAEELPDPAALPSVIATIEVSNNPAAVAVNPTTNRIYVAIPASHAVAVLDGTTNAVSATIDFSDVSGSAPSSVAVNPTTNRIYVGDSTVGAVYVVDGQSNARVAIIPNVGNIWQIAANPTNNKVYAAITNAVIAIDGATNAVLATTRIGNATATSVPSSVAVNPTTNRIYATTGAERFVSVFDSQTNLGTGGILIPPYFASLAVNPTTNRIYGSQTHNLFVVDGTRNERTGVIGLPGFSLGGLVAVNPTTNRVYVPVHPEITAGQASLDVNLAVVDGTSGVAVATMPIGSGVPSVAVNPTTNRVYVGAGASNTVVVIADPLGPTEGSILRDGRYFSQTGYRIDDDAIWNYFNRRGGVTTFGYPTSRTFELQGFLVQMFQRRVIQLDGNGSPRLLNLLDPGLLPYTSFNGATFPGVDANLVGAAPDPTNSSAVLAFVQAHAPDQLQEFPVNFHQTFVNAVPFAVAYPDGVGNADLLPGFDLELWGVPTSAPALDPNNANFVYLRFQRGIMMFDAGCVCTQGILLADYFKSILTGQNLPADLTGEAKGSLFYKQYDSAQPGWVHDPVALPSTDLTNAFAPE